MQTLPDESATTKSVNGWSLALPSLMTALTVDAIRQNTYARAGKKMPESKMLFASLTKEHEIQKQEDEFAELVKREKARADEEKRKRDTN